MKVYEKLAEVQRVIEQPAFDSSNPHFKSRFASLSECNRVVMEAVRKVGGCACYQKPVRAGEEWQVDTVFCADGEAAILASVPFIRDANPQKMGSGITYARRYSLCAAFCLVAEEDDDGNAAAEPKRKPKGYAAVKKSEPTFMDLCNQVVEKLCDGDMDGFQRHLKQSLGMDPDKPFDKSRMDEGRELMKVMLTAGTVAVSQQEMDF